jgi:hypothetical protein
MDATVMRRPGLRQTASVARVALALVVAPCLVMGIVGGLIRAGTLPLLSRDFVLTHAFLMMCGFLGTAIAVERAVAVKSATAVAAVAAFATAGLLTIIGLRTHGAWVAVVAAALFFGVNVRIFVRQPVAHTALLVAAAIACVFGNLLYASGLRPQTAVAWWFCFLVLTVGAERLEITRVMRRPRGAVAALYAIAGMLVAGCVVMPFSELRGNFLFGFSLLGLAAWLARFDIARRTVRAEGLSRYVAVCLLLGYAWLSVAGVAWMAGSFGYATRDIALHALGLGFIFSMILGHAPIVLPAVARIDLRFSPILYAPVALLHGSLVLRLAGGAFDAINLRMGAAGNAIAIAVFVVTVIALVARSAAPALGGGASRTEIFRGGQRNRPSQTTR